MSNQCSDDLRISPPGDATNLETAKAIRNTNAVALHVRWFDPPGSGSPSHGIPVEYYQRAIQRVQESVADSWFYVFSNSPERVRNALPLPESRTTIMLHNNADESAGADFWLMSLCRHFIVANSTFSW